MAFFSSAFNLDVRLHKKWRKQFHLYFNLLIVLQKVTRYNPYFTGGRIPSYLTLIHKMTSMSSTVYSLVITNPPSPQDSPQTISKGSKS